MTLIERLRQWRFDADQVPDELHLIIMAEAADRIEALEAQLERQGRLVDWYQTEHPQQVHRIEELEQQVSDYWKAIEALSTDVARLKAALREIINYESGSNTHPVVRIARAALKEDKNDETV